MYKNLEKELRRKNITNKTLAAMIGCNEKSVYNKITGSSDFTLTEAMVISQDILPEFQLAYLFAKTYDAA